MANKPTPLRAIEIADPSDKILTSMLATEGFQITSYTFFQISPSIFEAEHPDLVLVNLQENHGGGLAICRNLRLNLPQCAICLIHDDLSEWEESIALELGADVIIQRPCSPRRVLAQARALLRRHHHIQSPRLQLLSGSRLVRVSGQSISLTAAEFDLLDFLAQHSGSVVSRESISRHLRGLAYDGCNRTIDLRIARIRRKLGDNALNPHFILTVRGEGYMLMAEDI